MSEDPFVTIVFLAPIFMLVSFISSTIMGRKCFRPLRLPFIILVAPGIILHEISQYLLCRLAGVRVEDFNLLDVDMRWNIKGHLETEPIENSFLKPFLIAITPSFINTILACVLIMVLPYFRTTWTKLLIYWLVASLILGCRPSLHGLATAFKSIFKYPKNCLRELGCLGIGFLFGLILWKVSPGIIGISLPPMLIATFSLLAIIVAYAILK
jgi:hypothetical protein